MKLALLSLAIIGTVLVIEGQAQKCTFTQPGEKRDKYNRPIPVKRSVLTNIRHTFTEGRNTYKCGGGNEPHYHFYNDRNIIGHFNLGGESYYIQEENRRNQNINFGVCCRFKNDLVDRLRAGNQNDIAVIDCIECMRRLAAEVICRDHWENCPSPTTRG